jgi:NhaA family Na+:H+ antiporter
MDYPLAASDLYTSSLLPVFAAVGGVVLPALIHYSFNAGTSTQAGIGIPMATDIAFSLGVLALLGNRIPASLKVFLTALAVSDDLAAIFVIAVFYTSKLSILYFAGAIAVLGLLVLLNRLLHVMSLIPYLLGGAVMWVLLLKSGVHATIAGVLLAFTIPFSARQDDKESPSHKLEHALYWPVAFVILPLFALANTGVVITASWAENLTSSNSLEIMLGLVLGKPLGITLLSFVAIALGICKLPDDVIKKWPMFAGAN